MVIDDFLPWFDELRAYSLTADYQTIENPVDGVEYPYIAQLPEPLWARVEDRLREVVPDPTVHRLFLRASPKGVHCPHIVHNDASMGDMSLMLYLNDKRQCRGGTAIVEPREEMTVEQMQERANDPEPWQTVALFPMVPNRAAIFPAVALHRAEPVGGFGSTPEDWRVVLTAFFS